MEVGLRGAFSPQQRCCWILAGSLGCRPDPHCPRPCVAEQRRLSQVACWLQPPSVTSPGPNPPTLLWCLLPGLLVCVGGLLTVKLSILAVSQPPLATPAPMG